MKRLLMVLALVGALLFPTPSHAATTWTLIRNVDLTHDTGFSYTTGVRTTDQSYNRKAQVAFDSTGMTITAERACDGCTIYSADVQGRQVPLPDHFKIVADITLSHVGSGMFPALWLRPAGAPNLGELDVWEYLGANVGKSNEMKSTVIQTGTNPYNQGSQMFPIPKADMAGGMFAGEHVWRYEKTAGSVHLWVDGTLVGSIDKTSWDAQYGAGAWHAQFENGEGWYPRFTFQVGNGSAVQLAGPIPSTWRSSTYHVSSLSEYSTP